MYMYTSKLAFTVYSESKNHSESKTVKHKILVNPNFSIESKRNIPVKPNNGESIFSVNPLSIKPHTHEIILSVSNSHSATTTMNLLIPRVTQ
jgi:hypothetical protein